jgi:hypothetical protein
MDAMEPAGRCAVWIAVAVAIFLVALGIGLGWLLRRITGS